MATLSELTGKYAQQLARLESVEVLQAKAAALKQTGALKLVLGLDSQGSEICAFGSGVGERKMLLIGAPTGEGLLTAGVALQIIEHLAGDNWQMWTIPALSPSAMRSNEAALDTKLTLKEMTLARRASMEAGSNPLIGLPVDNGLLWQPDYAPENAAEDFAGCSPESLALAKAIKHLKPDLLLVLDESLAGPAELAVSQDLAPAKLEQLAGAVQCVEAPLMPARAPLRVWRGEASVSHPTLTLLQPFSELQSGKARLLARKDVLKVLKSGKGKITGGISVWQFAQWQDCGLCVMVTLPRFSSPQLANSANAGQQRQVIVGAMEDESGQWNVVWKLASGKFAGTEVMRRKRGQQDRPGEATVALSKGMLAIESCCARRELLSEALRQLALITSEAPGQQLAVGLLTHHQSEMNGKAVSWRTTRRYHLPATVAEMCWWSGVFAVQTAQLLSAARAQLLKDDRTDPDVASCTQWLEQQIEILTDGAEKHLQPMALKTIGELSAAAVEQALIAVDEGAFDKASRRQRLEQLPKLITALKRDIRSMKQLKEPPKKRAVKQQQLDELQAELRSLRPAEVKPVTSPDDAHTQAVNQSEQPLPAAEPVAAHEPAVQDDVMRELLLIPLRFRGIDRVPLTADMPALELEPSELPFVLRSRGL